MLRRKPRCPHPLPHPLPPAFCLSYLSRMWPYNWSFVSKTFVFLPSAYFFPPPPPPPQVLYTHLYQASNTVMVVCSWFFVLVATAVVSMLSLRFVILLFSRFAVPGLPHQTCCPYRRLLLIPSCVSLCEGPSFFLLTCVSHAACVGVCVSVGVENEAFDVKTNGVRTYSSSVPADLDGEPVL